MQFYTDYLTGRGEKKYRIDQVHQAVYRDFVDSFLDITTLSQALREQMHADLPFSPLTLVQEKISSDGTVKVLLKTHDGYGIDAPAATSWCSYSFGSRCPICKCILQEEACETWYDSEYERQRQLLR